MPRVSWDLNVWDRLSHETNGVSTGLWTIDVYPSGSSHVSPATVIWLTGKQANRMLLGDEGDDWWTDPESFLFNYSKAMPRKVRRVLACLEAEA
jgi:hypothetical protein